MEHKVNSQAVEAYAQAFAGRVLDYFFSKNEKISGKQILELSPIRQVNLFVLKNLYDKWQVASAKARSPYFDYDHADVKEAHKRYMNLLSQHILMDRAHLEPLLIDATHEALLLILAPVPYFESVVELLANPQLSAVRLREMGRYVQVNRFLIDALIAEIEGKGNAEIYVGEAKRVLIGVANDQKERITPADKALVTFDAIVQVRLEDLTEITKSGKPEQAQSLEAETSSLFDNLVPDLDAEAAEVYQTASVVKPEQTPQETAEAPVESPVKATTSTPVVEPPIVAPQPVPAKVVVEAPKQEPMATPAEKQAPPVDPVVDITPEPQPVVPAANIESVLPPVAEIPSIKLASIIDEETDKNAEKTINDQFSKEQVTLNDQLKDVVEKAAEPTVLEKHSMQKIESIRNAIPINEKYMYINDLFDGDNITWSIALQELDQVPTLNDALALLNDNYAKRFNWDMSSQRVQEFIALISRKF